MKRRGALLALSSLALPACASAPPPLATPLPAPPLHLAPVTDLFAAAGLDWLVMLRPSELARTMAAQIAKVLPAANLDKLAAHLGFDVRLADALVIGGYGETTLYAIQVVHDGRAAEQRFAERLSSDVERATDGRIRRTSGRIGTVPRAFADLDETVLLYEVGAPGPLKAALAFSQGKLKRAKPALATEPLAELQKRLGDAPVLAMAPRPSRVGWVQGAHGLLSHATSIGGAATPDAEGLRLRGVALGAWDEPPTEALKRLESTVADVARSMLGRLMGLDQPLAVPSFGGDREGIRFEATVDASKLAEGLWAATSAELGELFGKRLARQPRSTTAAPACASACWKLWSVVRF